MSDSLKVFMAIVDVGLVHLRDRSGVFDKLNWWNRWQVIAKGLEVLLPKDKPKNVPRHFDGGEIIESS